MAKQRLAAALITATLLGAGLLVLQRWVADTKTVAIILVGAWFVIVGLAAVAVALRRRELRLPVLGTYALILVASVVIGYLTGFRDERVDEDILVATAQASERERAESLKAAQPETEPKAKKPSGPVELASGRFSGADGHAGGGLATYVRSGSGDRTLTFSDFDVDPGVRVVVWLTRDDTSLEDRVDLGVLKGNVGDQQYELPADVDLGDYDTVVLYCTPFTVRIATVELS